MNRPTPTPYEDLLGRVIGEGALKNDRTGTGTYSVFGAQLRYDLSAGFPLITTKKVFTRGIVEELLWFLRGSTNEHELRDKGVNIWREWAPEDGDLSPVYGYQWRSWPDYDGGSIDQISRALETLRNDPEQQENLNMQDLNERAFRTPSGATGSQHSLRLDFVGGTSNLTVEELIDLLESDGIIDDALGQLEETGHWVNQNRLVEHGPEGYQRVQVIDFEKFSTELASARENTITLRFEDADSLRNALRYLGESDAPVEITDGTAVIDGVSHPLWEDFDEALEEVAE